jgi:GDP-4-dehydro-6-deoxy-D-mannose reductase
LITGATGFAGSFLVEHYVSRGWRVHGTYREVGEDRSWVPDSVTLHPLDLRDQQAVFDLVRAVAPHLTHHLAAQSSVSMSWRDPMATIVDNVTSQFNVLEALVKFGEETRVVVVGSCDEYGNVPEERNPVPETHVLQPSNPYGLSKVAQDLMGRQYFEAYGLQVVRTRPFLQVGPRRTSQFVAGSFARQIAEIERGFRTPVIEVGNIDLLRDFTDVRDMARAYALVGEKGQPGEVYNIASGEAHSLREMLHCMMLAAGVDADIRRNPDLQRPGETALLIGDASRLKARTGWAPTISFEQSAADTVTYWLDHIRQGMVREGNPR